MAFAVLRKRWRGAKPGIHARLNWAIAPASLVGAWPLNDQSGMPMDHVTGLLARGVIGGRTTVWTEDGLEFLGKGVSASGAPPVSLMPQETVDKLSGHRVTVAWGQIRKDNSGADQRTFGNGVTAGFTWFIASPIDNANPRQIYHSTGTDALQINAQSSLIFNWHDLMVSFSSGQGEDTRPGWAAWDDGLLLGTKSSYAGAAGPPMDVIAGDKASVLNSLEAIIRYVYVFDEFMPNDTGLAALIHDNPYVFFDERPPVAFSIPSTVRQAWVTA